MLVDSLLASADRGATRLAVSDPSQALDYAGLVRFADVMRRQIESVTKCERVGIMMPSSCAFAGTLYGILWAGRTALPLNFLLQPAEIAAIVADAGIDTIIGVKHFSPLLNGLPVKTKYIEDLNLAHEMSGTFTAAPPPKTTPDDIALLLYTSGTSGNPKGVCLSHGGLKYDVDACANYANLREGHRFLGILPLFHTFGITAMLFVPAAIGASAHYLPRFSPGTILSTIREQRSSVLMMVASMYAAILRGKSGDKADFASVEYPISGGEALPMAVYDAFKERFGIEILQGYGMTEASPVVSLNVPWAHKLGTVGKPLPGVEVKAYDDNGQQLPPDGVGELWIKGPTIMKGYYNKEADTCIAVNEHGWYKSGDMGKVDADGYITITGRKKEMIIVGGENVYPREIEAVLESHPAVAEAAVIGQMDASRGEVVVGFVILKEGETATELALRDHCRNHIANYKVPRKVIIAEQLPRGPTGKILKRKLVELLPTAD